MSLERIQCGWLQFLFSFLLRGLNGFFGCVQFVLNDRKLFDEQFLQPGASRPSTQEAPYIGPRGREQQEHFSSSRTVHSRTQSSLCRKTNPIQRAQMSSPDTWSFEDSLARVFGPHGEFADWTGRRFVSVARTDVLLTFQPTCGTGRSVSFTDGYPADPRSAARLPLSSALAQKLRDAWLGGLYRVSGHLFVRNSETHFSSVRWRPDRPTAAFESAHVSGIVKWPVPSTWSSSKTSSFRAISRTGRRTLT